MIEVFAIWIALGALGAFPALIAMRVAGYKVAIVMLTISAVMPLGLAQLQLVNPAFGGWIVLALPYWGGCAVALLLLANVIPTGWLSRQDEGN